MLRRLAPRASITSTTSAGASVRILRRVGAHRIDRVAHGAHRFAMHRLWTPSTGRVLVSCPLLHSNPRVHTPATGDSPALSAAAESAGFVGTPSVATSTATRLPKPHATLGRRSPTSAATCSMSAKLPTAARLVTSWRRPSSGRGAECRVCLDRDVCRRDNH